MQTKQQRMEARQEQRADLTLSYWHRQIVRLLRLNAVDLADLILHESERNPCLEVEFTGFAAELHVERTAAQELDFRLELKQQLGGAHTQRTLARLLVDALDDDGYLRQSLPSLAKVWGAQTADLTKALKLVQALEPAGVGARNLRECYLLQLARNGQKGSDAWCLIKHAFEPLAQRDTAQVLRRLGWNHARLEAAREALLELAFAPVTQGGSTAQYVVPDAEVVKGEQGYQVRLLEHALPKVGLSAGFVASAGDRGAGSFVHQGLFYARRFLYCLQRRNQTLLDVLQIAVQRQQGYLEGGARVQLRMGEVAGELSVHPSTVTHAVAAKYVKYNDWVFPARSLFAAGGVQGASGDQLKGVVAQMIEDEDAAHPLSDQALCDLLAEHGLIIARRTVTKYRNELYIAPAARRKVW